MDRPCVCGGVSQFDIGIGKPVCWFCKLFYTDPDYNRLWGGDGNVQLQKFSKAKPHLRPRCTWQGEPTGETRDCPVCGKGVVPVPLLACPRHGRCIEDKLVSGIQCCRICPDMLPATMPPIKRRHLHFFIMPVMRNGVWQKAVARLVERMPLFNGTRAVAIVKGRGLDPVEKVQEAFKGTVNEWVISHNVPSLREMLTYFPLLEKMPPAEEGDAVFCGHSKGCTKPVNDGVSVHKWGDIMYESCLDYWPYVSKLLQAYPCAGSFKKIGYGFDSASAWHYSGTFYWMRLDELMNEKRNWRHHDETWWGTETYPSLHFSESEAGCIFRQGYVPELNLYSLEYLREKVLPQWEEWKREHASERTDWSSLASTSD